jgi:integrase
VAISWPGGARFHIPDAKTETGVRTVEMSPDLAGAFVRHLDRLRRAGKGAGLDDYVVQNSRGGRTSRQRVAAIVREAATLASETREDQGLPPLPRTTPHSLRRTYISIALLANNFDVKWVMSQVGHADSKMTLDVYTQLEQQIKRDHSRRFDDIVRSAEEQMHGDDLRGRCRG